MNYINFVDDPCCNIGKQEQMSSSVQVIPGYCSAGHLSYVPVQWAQAGKTKIKVSIC